MTTDTITLAELATEARGYLHRGERIADGIGQILVPVNAPEWVTELCRDAHLGGNMLPDDWRYEFIGDALDCLAEADDREPIEAFDEWFDGGYIYTSQQTAWLASHPYRCRYCDDAAEEHGGECGDLMQRIALGMAYEAREVFQAVWQSLTDRLEATTDA